MILWSEDQGWPSEIVYGKKKTRMLLMAFDLLQNLVFTLYGWEYYLIYAEFNATTSLQNKWNINDKVCLWEESSGYKAQEWVFIIHWKKCARGRRAIKNLYFFKNEILHLNFPTVFCAVSYLAILLSAGVCGQRCAEGKGKEGEDKCGCGVKAKNCNRSSLLHDSCAILTSFQI